ncbi:hypothetical protein SODALDRAFT_330025 [Sodiomyces alkalinus F11]|uniref:Hook C-terminal domain-containing protein n=1 Tax=Sodiomyces alkalinus (strain CBS 110278 / VKM F-3762 / F11) TaxID=1314773 RepID=A0A3N2Q121_SODAK|nr:hypothetical protein SODALDRAFT_330025 [Sodiomyces alkalinus F11]ROT40315.1 hypothetical protein SODALDRAFT_330025 [Sodiomyces alkalinus F11]
MTFSKGAQDALRLWANTFSLSRNACSVEDFYDGLLLSEMLADLDQTYDTAGIDSDPRQSLAKKRNLQHVYKGLVKLINLECPGLNRQARIANFRATASNPDAEGICKILSLLFAVAMLGSNNERFVTRITRDITDKPALSILQKITVEMKAEIEDAEANLDTDPDADDARQLARDPDLALEEENASLMSQLDRKMKLLADMETRLAHLQESYESLKEEAARQARELEDFHNAQSGAASQVIQALEAKIREQDELIASHEAQAEEFRIARERLAGEISSLSSRANKADDLEDEVNVLRYRNDELSRKANVVERYRQKLEAQGDLQKEIDNLMYEREQMQRDLLDYEKILKRNEALEDTNNKYASKLQDYETQFIEMDTTRKREYSEMLHLRELLRTLEAQRKSDEEFISELQDQINNGGVHSIGSKSSEFTNPGFNLEQELENAKDVAPNLSLEISRLKAENQMLRSTAGSGPEVARLRHELEGERTQHKRLQEKYRNVYEKRNAADAQVSALMQDLPQERLVQWVERLHPSGHGKLRILTQEYFSTKVFNELKSQLKKAEEELKAERELARDLRNKILDRDREILSARTDLSAVEKDSAEALEELKATDKLISSSLQEELEALRLEYKNMSNDADEAQRALVKALLEKDNLRKEIDLAKDQSVSSDALKSNEKIKQLRARLQERNEQLEKAERDRHDLMRKLKASQDGSAALAQKAQSDQIIKNLQRENALVTTAWYDLTSRLQSNHVVLQRRNDVPRSWLNKQRQMVNATPRK